ncbi:MAG: hypothetical protein E7267_07330 [Lachnospiraceae bacterium]|nr:hypothetical protein [Lachnospiraceae bacterium]
MLDRIAEYLREIFSSRLIPISIIFFTLFFLLIVRMFNLQIVKSDDTYTGSIISDEKKRDVVSTRGKIYDRNGVLLATNQLSYDVTIEDNGTLTTNADKNEMIYNMIQIIYKNGDSLAIDFFIDINKNGDFYFTCDKSAELRFKRDAYFSKSIDDLTDEQKNASAYDMFVYLKTDVSSSGPKFDISDEYSDKDALDIIKVRYTMMINSNTKYIPVTVANNVNDTTVVAIKENSDILSGVKISETADRYYYDSKYFSNIIGYTGTVSTDDLDKLKEDYPDYNYAASDQIGKSGIELSMEETLRGIKGSETLVIDAYSRVNEIKDETSPVPGDDVYLTIDANLQKACYDILEKELAGILISKLNNSMDAGTKGESASDIRIPIYDVYSAVFSNNIVDTTLFSAKKASQTEKSVYNKFLSQKKAVAKRINTFIDIKYTSPRNNLSDENAAYLDYIYKMLKDNNIVLTSNIDTSSEEYKNYLEGKSSLSEYLEYLIVNNCIDFGVLDIGDNLYTTSELFDVLKNYIIKKIDNNTGFDKIIYKYMIYNYKISGTEICLLLIDQNIVKAEGDTLGRLISGSLTPYSFIKSKIISLELTPAMLALDPCSGSIVITDVKTGDILAYVSYPTYDNNKLANKIDSSYYSKLLDDSSYPLMNRPSMQKTAPGSTFKMVTSTAALEEYGILSYPLEKIKDRHLFEKVVPSPKCWSSSSHGKIDVMDALRDSCNYYYYEIGYRLGTTGGKILNHDKGLKTLKKYASMYGLNDLSGVELSESNPQISDYDCVRSAIGQGTNSYTPVQLSRYITTIANSGICYDLTLIDKVISASNGSEKDNNAKVHNNVDIKSDTWNYIHAGMRKVIKNGTIKGLYDDLNIDVAGKTGTAQESDYKPNHALFVSYAPYSSPEISVTTVIPNGYTSGNAAELARDVYTYYYDKDSRKKLLNKKVQVPENQSNAFSD